MRTQDMNRYENLARSLARGSAVDPAYVDDVLRAARHSPAELEQRTAFFRDRFATATATRTPSPLEEYQQDARLLGMEEGVAVIVLPQVALALLVLTVGLLFSL